MSKIREILTARANRKIDPALQAEWKAVQAELERWAPPSCAYCEPCVALSGGFWKGFTFGALLWCLHYYLFVAQW